MRPDDPTAGGSSTSDPSSGGTNGDGSRARRILTGISPRAWEHPADRAALQALRRIPVFDDVLRKLFGFFGEKPIRLAFQANSVRVSPNQFPRVHKLYLEVLRTMDAPEEYPLYISQTPVVNAGAYGMDQPFVILNSGMLHLLDDEELQYVMAHEIGHILSGHVLYHTMLVILVQLAERGFPIVGLAARAILVALLEWYRKSELSSDRAGLLGVQDPRIVYRAMLAMAGGGGTLYHAMLASGRPGTPEVTSVPAFLEQAEAYQESHDVMEAVFKVLNVLGTTHPFYVLRVSELKAWIESGAYDEILKGNYPRRGDPEPEYISDLSAAATSYKEGAKDFVDDLATSAKKMRDSLFDTLRGAGRQ